MRSIAIVVMTAIMAMPAAAHEQPVQLKQGPGLDKVESNCGACHSLDYIPMNSPFLNAVGWGAPIDQADARVIAEYLGTNYGLRLRPDSPRAPEGSNPRQRYGSAGIRPKGLASRPPARIGTQWRPPLNFSWLTKVARGPHAASRRHPGC
jgi:sulfite dehydrogenase (cytochrome) subunit B